MSARRSACRRLVAADRGVESVELAVSFLLLAMVLFSGFEFGWAMTQSSHLQHAARVGAREAALQGSNAATVTARVQSTLADLGITTADVSLVPTEPELALPGTPVEVQVTVDYATIQLLGLTALMPLPARLASKAAMVKEPLR